jgi:hypothetical protein
MKDKIEQWVLPRINTIMNSLEFEECSGYVNTFSGIVNDCFNDLQPQWVSVDSHENKIKADAIHKAILDNGAYINDKTWHVLNEYANKLGSGQ